MLVAYMHVLTLTRFEGVSEEKDVFLSSETMVRMKLTLLKHEEPEVDFPGEKSDRRWFLLRKRGREETDPQQ